MIADHMARYCEARGIPHWGFRIVRSVVVDGHESAWVEALRILYRDGGEITYIEPLGSYEFLCECKLTEGVGWRIDAERKEGYINIALDVGDDRCIYKEAAMHLRHLELRREYQRYFEWLADSEELTDEQRMPFILFGIESAEAVRGIILDLVERAKRGEWLEASGGAAFWGGYFYLQTVQSITGAGDMVLNVARQMVEEKLISLEGAVVQKYRKPRRPRWNE